MKLGDLQKQVGREALQYFYAFVRDIDTAKQWHLHYTPFFENHEIDMLIKDYDYEEIKNIWDGKNGNQLQSLILKQ